MSSKRNLKILNRALSIHQPFAEQIMQGIKKFEYRSPPTNIRERVYIYASLKPNEKAFEKTGKEPGDFPVSVLIGTVEITDCNYQAGEYHWRLAKPKRLKKLIKPEGHPQPVWFKPFKE
jgi:predicted transcriptional regulator